MKINIRKMQPEDCSALAQIDKEAFSEPLSEQGFMREYSNESSYTIVAVCGEEIIGYCNLWNICGEVTLNNIAVRKEYRGEGAGSYLLEKALAHFSSCDFITLEVRKSNAAAIGLYEKYGFRTVGERKNFYRLPTEDALLMTLFCSDITNE